ncbi:MAG: F0F1 ATP synthase subunit B [Armatimonadota bacterium]
MGTDWFTFVAQIINFLVLVWLLKHFLYGPIINAMETREERIASRLREAEKKIADAEEAERRYHEQVREIEQRREEMLQNAEKEAQQRREELLEEVRREVEQAEERWHRAAQREREIFLQELQERVGRETIGVIRRILADLADDELERLIITRFAERLTDVDEEQ